MKPLKTENEASSNMKSTIKYTFVAPGAIGKGQGQGLKSLGEKGNTPSKSLLPQSSDLVKKYIKEIETSSTEKDKGQGLKKSTVFTSQGMQTIYKNSMVPEKENKQINLSFPTSSIKVEKCTEEVETSSSNPTKVKKVRGSNMCKEVASLEIGQKLKVTFYNNRTVGANSNLFSRHLGKIVRDRNICPLGVSSWHDIKEEKLNHMWAAIEHKFESVDMNDHLGMDE
ncbi:hypothetical protein H5410_001547 [Solanum commersonii]|uniref:Uncharacterized protein n=1 Tax=Solanum commersonii TaxID=4109 RepID=A0A9J6AZ98_SOLCO|nr:hypothetical protein H5410_001547 [Solanum commersonii]